MVQECWVHTGLIGSCRRGLDLPADSRSATIHAAVESAFTGVREGLERLVRIPSVSAADFDPGEVRRSADATATWLQRCGLGGVRLLEIKGAHPAVFGATRGPVGSPTVLLYAHHDVQPPGPEGPW